MNVTVIATAAEDAAEIVRRLAPGAVVKKVHEEEGAVSVPALFDFWCLARAATYQKPSERVNIFVLKRSD